MEETNTEAADHGIFVPNEDAATETLVGIPCPKCGKTFKNAVAVRMHNARVHTKILGTGYQWKGHRVMTREERLAKKRIYNRKWRAKRGMAVRPKSFKENKDGRFKTGMKWSPLRRKRFIATMKKKAMSKVGKTMFEAGGEKPKPTPVQSVTFCPRCGCNIEVVRKAIEFADRV